VYPDIDSNKPSTNFLNKEKSWILFGSGNPDNTKTNAEVHPAIIQTRRTINAPSLRLIFSSVLFFLLIQFPIIKKVRLISSPISNNCGFS